jgi:hypothetical protein
MALDNAPDRRVVYSAITVDDAVAEANDAIQLWDAISSGGINAAKAIERLSNDLKLASTAHRN